MANGTYLGGSTLIQTNPKRSKRKIKGLLSLEVEFSKTGRVAPQSLTTPNPKKRRAKSQRALAPGGKVAARSPAGKGARATPNREPKPTIPLPSHSPRYSAAEIREYLLPHHPNCTGRAAKRVAGIADKGSWSRMSTGYVVASCMEQYLLYEVCGLSHLVDLGLARPEALKLVTPQVIAVLGLWGAKPVWLK